MSTVGKCLWVMTWPISFVLYVTIPDCRKHVKWYPASFIMCMVWIGSTSYTVAWFITVIGLLKNFLLQISQNIKQRKIIYKNYILLYCRPGKNLISIQHNLKLYYYFSLL